MFPAGTLDQWRWRYRQYAAATVPICGTLSAGSDHAAQPHSAAAIEESRMSATWNDSSLAIIGNTQRDFYKQKVVIAGEGLDETNSGTK